MGAGISVRNETELPILVVCSQLTPLHWGRCDPGETWNAKNSHNMGKVWFSVSVSLYTEKSEPSKLATAAKIAGITVGFILLGPLIKAGLIAVAGITAARGTSKHGVYADCTCLVVRGIKFPDGKYQFYFAAQEHLNPKTGAIKSVTTFEVPRSVEHAHPPPEPVLYGMEVKLMHSSTRARLQSSPGLFYPSREFLPSSELQTVSCFENDRVTDSDSGEWWLIEAEHGQTLGERVGKPILGGDKIRIMHVATSRRLRSSDEIPAFVQPDRDVLVGCGTVNQSDPECDWVLECGGQLLPKTKLKLVHDLTGLALHSHSHKQPYPPKFQEVTCSKGRSDEDFWEVFEMRPSQLDDALDDLDLAGPDEAPSLTPDEKSNDCTSTISQSQVPETSQDS